MEKIARKLADIIGDANGQDEEKRQVVAYGLSAIFQMIVLFVITLAIGIIFDFLPEAMVLFLGVGLLRKSIGGAHASTMLSCITISVIMISLLSAVSRYLLYFKYNYIIVSAVEFVLYLICFILIYKLAPVDSRNKPIVKQKKINRLRKEAFITISVYFCVSFLLLAFYKFNSRFLNVSASFALATLWQCFMLTKAGHFCIQTIDKPFSVKSKN